MICIHTYCFSDLLLIIWSRLLFIIRLAVYYFLSCDVWFEKKKKKKKHLYKINGQFKLLVSTLLYAFRLCMFLAACPTTTRRFALGEHILNYEIALVSKWNKRDRWTTQWLVQVVTYFQTKVRFIREIFLRFPIYNN